MARGPARHEASVVFISDGADNDPSTLAARLDEVGGPPDNVKRCALFVVAVGAHFPAATGSYDPSTGTHTRTLLDALRGWIGGADDGLRLLTPLNASGAEYAERRPGDCRDEAAAVFGELTVLVFYRCPPPSVVLSERHVYSSRASYSYVVLTPCTHAYLHARMLFSASACARAESIEECSMYIHVNLIKVLQFFGFMNIVDNYKPNMIKMQNIHRRQSEVVGK